MKLKAVALAAALVAVSLPTTAHANGCRDDVELRLEVLATAFDDQILGLKIWSYSWGSIYAALAVTQGIVVATQEPNNPTRVDLAFGAISAAVGSLGFWLLPLRFIRPLERVRAEWDEPDRCKLLARAEATRARVDSEQRLGKSWIAHAGNVVVNVAIALTLGFAFGHWEGGIISGAVGLVVGEINLLSQPTKLWRVAEPSPNLRLVPIVSRDFTGAGLIVIF